MRKFKNSNGWQKLWVVFTSFSLFFYKSHLVSNPFTHSPFINESLSHPLQQGSATGGPRAITGPPDIISAPPDYSDVI